MAQHRVTVSETPSLFSLIIQAIAFLLRNQVTLGVLVLPIVALAAIAAHIVGTFDQFAFLRHPEGWDFLFALIYAMFLDRWIKEALLEDATDCDEVDAFRRTLVPAPLLLFTIVFLLFAMALSWLRLQGIEFNLLRAGLPRDAAAIAATVVAWLPHLLVWATVVTAFALLLPAWCAGQRPSLRQNWRTSAPVRGKLFRLILGATALSLVTYAVTNWGLEAMPYKRWVPAAMIGAQRLVDLLLLAIVGHVLATLFRVLTDWQQPEPEERPFRARGRRAAASR